MNRPAPSTNPATTHRVAHAFAHAAGAAGVFALAAAVRLLFLLTAPDRAWPHSVWFEGDAPVWMQHVAAIHAGRPFELGLPLRAPGTALLLYVLTPWGLPADCTWLKAAWCLISAGGCAAAYAAYRAELPGRAAWIGAGLCALAFSDLVTATSLNSETPYMAVVCAAVLMTNRFRADPAFGRAVVLGVVHAAGMLLRAEHALLMAMLCPLALCSPRSAAPRVHRGIARRAAALVVMALTSVVFCLPWTLHAQRNIVRLNTVCEHLPDYDLAPLPWTADARAFLDGLPAFARKPNFDTINHLWKQSGARRITATDVQRFFHEGFGYVPERISTAVFVSAQGPLSFALANHPQAGGGFSKAGLDARMQPDPDFNIAAPSHLRLLNHGYAVGWEHIRSNPAGWLRLVGAKLSRFAAGFSQGLTAWNLPLPPYGVRWPVDAYVARQPAWSAGLAAVCVVGAAIALRRRVGSAWVLVLAYKFVVTVLFYGYARQAASILPALYFFAAVGVAYILDNIRWRAGAHGGRWVMTLGGLIAGVGVAATCVFHREMEADGPRRPSPHWGPAAFESPAELHLRPAGSRPAGGNQPKPSGE